ncbi:MAG: protein-disulfide reductase DsbD family protein [Gammaproteobacteria bacterium]
MSNKHVIVFFLLSLFGLGCAYGNAPEAVVQIKRTDLDHWPAAYTLTMTVPEHHHAYLDRGSDAIYIPIEIDPAHKLKERGLMLRDLSKPAGIYDDEVNATVLRNSGDFSFSLASVDIASLTADSTLEIRYQLCNEQTHVCFRPQKTSLNLPLPKVDTAAPVGEPADSMARLTAVFTEYQNNTPIIFALMFIAGLLSVATPCVYPMLPITSMFILNRANGDIKKEKQHALVYLLGIVGTYMLLGLIAGMTGGAFNAVMQSAAVNLAFAVFFAFFAMSLLGFYELSFMQNEVHSLDRRSARVKGLTGTWLMGSVAGLVISPCVGPIVFALLLQVADNIAEQAKLLAAAGQSIGFWDKFAISARGSLMMAGFGLGVGLPFFIVSVVKFRNLPRAGYWMNKIKYAFGFAILYFAYTYFHKGMGVLGVDDASIAVLAAAMVAIWFAVVHCNVLSPAPADAAPNVRLHRYCGVISLLIGGWLFTAGMNQIPFVKNASALATAERPTGIDSLSDTQHESEGGIVWYRNFNDARNAAIKSGKPIFIDFYASWCANCVAFKEETARNPELNEALREHAVTLKLIDGEAEFEKFKNLPEHRQLKIGLPYFAILTPQGRPAWSSTDYKATRAMIDKLSALYVENLGTNKSNTERRTAAS